MKQNFLLLLIKLIFTNFKGLKKMIYPLKVMIAEEQYRRLLNKKYGIKQGLPTIDLLTLFPGFTENVKSYTYLDETSRVTDIAVIKALCRQYTDCNYLEIGSWRGESLVNAAEVVKNCVSVSLPEDDVVRIWGERSARVSRLFSRNIANIKHVEANSHTFDFSTLNMKFDVIFVDGDHTCEGVIADTKKVLGLLKDENSIILWHDYGKSYELINWETYAAIIEAIPEEERTNLYHISNTLLAVYTKKKFEAEVLTTPQFPTKTFEINLVTKKFEK